MAGQRVAEREVWADLILIPPAHLIPGDVAGVEQIGEYPLSGTLGNTNFDGGVFHPNLGILRNGEQNMSMISEKRPSVQCAISSLGPTKFYGI